MFMILPKVFFLQIFDNNTIIDNNNKQINFMNETKAREISLAHSKPIRC